MTITTKTEKSEKPKTQKTREKQILRPLTDLQRFLQTVFQIGLNSTFLLHIHSKYIFDGWEGWEGCHRRVDLSLARLA